MVSSGPDDSVPVQKSVAIARMEKPRNVAARARLMLVVGVGRVRSSTILAEAAASEIRDQTSVLSEPFRSEMFRNPNSLRVGKVSDTFASSVNQPPYMAPKPSAVA